MLAGGLTGFVCTGGIMTTESPFVLIVAVPAVLFGQFGALRIYNSSLRMGPHPPESKCDLRQFGIRQMLLATAWIAAAFAILRLIPQGLYYATTAIAIWLPIHFLMLGVGYGMIRVHKQWKASWELN